MNISTSRSDATHRRRHRRVASSATAPAAPQRLLLVDDDEGVRESLAGVLVEEGYLVSPAANGAEALDIAAKSIVDLVILDLNMPVKNGWDTFERLSAEHPLVPVIIATARANQLFTALGAGVAALLEKPLEIPHLLATVRRLLAEPTEARLRRLAGKEATFEYRPGEAANPHTDSADTSPSA